MYYYQNNTFSVNVNYVYTGSNETTSTVAYSAESTTTTY